MIDKYRRSLVERPILIALFVCFLAAILSPKPTTQAEKQEQSAKRGTQKPVVAKSQLKGADEKPAPVQAKKVDTSIYKDGPKPEWVWGPNNETDYVVTKELGGEIKAAHLIASCDNVLTVMLNGQQVATSSNWQQPVRVDMSKALQADKNVLEIEARNFGGLSGLAARVILTKADGNKEFVTTDTSWKAAVRNKPESTVELKSHGKLGVQPWGNVFAAASATLASTEPRDVFNVLPGFQVELLYTVPKDLQGSWVCITTDPKGRIIASDQQNKGLYRITPPAIGSKEETQVEKLDIEITAAQGMLFAFDSLYISVNGGPGSGFYRARDTNGDDQFDEVVKLKAFQGGGEHGPHAIRLAPDGKSLYIVAGNHTDLPENFDASRQPPVWDEDFLLSRQWDARGHARGKLAPGGWIAKTDPDGKTWEIVSTGYRNTYDIDFNADGELFAYDADMEWDMGTPWYRPTRVVHATSGSEFGWRSGTGKWPTYFIDSLPQVVDIGPGSPVGATFGYGTKFPAKYQQALYLLDWTFGTMYAVHLEPDGASYTATKEEFLSRTPLPLTDATVGTDGALYFAVGGRNTDSELFRVTYVGDESTKPVDGLNREFSDLRALRHKLEALHAPADDATKAVDFIWPYLGHDDRHIGYAARVALENQPVATWQTRVFTETNPQRLTQSAIASARQGDASAEPKLLEALNTIDYGALDEDQQLGLLRAYSLVFIRLGRPDQATTSEIAEKLEPFYPAGSDELNRELCRVLAYLQSPKVIAKTLKLIANDREQSPAEMADLLKRNERYGGTIAQMLSNLPEIQNIHYALVLRNLRYGWTLEQRKEYFTWLARAREKSGGASYQGFIDNIRKEALENASEAERKAIESDVATVPNLKAIELPKPEGPGHDWSLDELLDLTKGGLQGRDFEHGKRSFAAVRCIVCHRFDGNGGATGPDLTSVAGRFSYKDLSESLVDPSKVVSDQYRASIIITVDGKTYTGRLAGDTKTSITILTDPEDPTKVVEVKKDDIDEMMPSKVSLMPKDLLKTLNKEEVLDLLAYLMSRGNPNDRMFRKAAE